MSLFIQDIRTALPARALDTVDAADLMRQTCRTNRTARLLSRITRLTSIERRHLAALEFQDGPVEERLYQPAANQPDGPGMGARQALFDRAAGQLVSDALEPLDDAALEAVRTLVTCSCTHASAPGLERFVFARSPVPTSVDRWNLGFMGCSAGLASLRLVHAAAARSEAALVVACELSSLHFQYSDDLDQITANLLFADGAAAVLLGATPARARIVDSLSVAVPTHAEEMVWFADDHGLRLHLSPDLPTTLGQHLPQTLSAMFERNGIQRSDVAHWLVHPGGPQVLDSVAACMQLRPDALDLSRDVLRRHGNMSSPTILFILKELLASDATGWCVALAFGPGLTVEAVLLHLA